MAIRKKIPTGEAEFDLLLARLNEKCPDYRRTLNISDAQLAVLSVNATCYHECRLLKDQLEDAKTGFTKFVQELFEGSSKRSTPPPPNLNFELPAMPDRSGIEEQTKKFIEYLELQDDFTDAIGLDLGFYVHTSDAVEIETRTGELKTKDYAGYETDVMFSLKGADAADVRWRVKGETVWNTFRATSSPYRLAIQPDPNGAAITLEMQLIYVKDNKQVGNWSDLKIVVARA